jgi:Cu2+-exporting ATPase
LSLPIVFYASSIFFTGALAALRARTLDMMVLVAVAVGVGWLYSVAATFFLEGEVFYEAAAMLASFVLLGHWFEMRARGGANDAIRALLDLAPPRALVIREGDPVEVPTAELQVGDLLLIRPGAKVPVDAEVAEGESEVDESTVTGESLPVSKRPGDQLVGATINKNGTLRARDRGWVGYRPGPDRAARAAGAELESTQSAGRRPRRFLARVRRARRRRPDLRDLVLRCRPRRSGGVAVRHHRRGHHLPRRPRLATPTAIMVGSGLGARRGILFKHAMGLEQAARLDTVVFDKTGTLTRGEPEVVAVATADGVREDAVLRLVAAAEQESEHPLAAAIVNAARQRGPDLPRAASFEAVPGHGRLRRWRTGVS